MTHQQLRGLIVNQGMNRTHGDLFIFQLLSIKNQTSNLGEDVWYWELYILNLGWLNYNMKLFTMEEAFCQNVPFVESANADIIELWGIKSPKQ